MTGVASSRKTTTKATRLLGRSVLLGALLAGAAGTACGPSGPPPPPEGPAVEVALQPVAEGRVEYRVPLGQLARFQVRCSVSRNAHRDLMREFVLPEEVRFERFPGEWAHQGVTVEVVGSTIERAPLEGVDASREPIDRTESVAVVDLEIHAPEGFAPRRTVEDMKIGTQPPLFETFGIRLRLEEGQVRIEAPYDMSCDRWERVY